MKKQAFIAWEYIYISPLAFVANLLCFIIKIIMNKPAGTIEWE